MADFTQHERASPSSLNLHIRKNLAVPRVDAPIQLGVVWPAVN
jgi:hypothetical protein